MMQSTQCTVSRTCLGRSMGTGLVEDQVVPLATAPDDRSRPGGTIPGEGTLSCGSRGSAGLRREPFDMM